MSDRPATTTACAWAALGATLTMTLGLTACSGDDAPRPTASDVTASDASQLRAGGTLRWAVESVPATFNAFRPDATADTATVADAVLPHLFVQDEHGRAKTDRDYLESAHEVSSGSSGSRSMTVEYHLNPKAVWSDGRPLSAADFAAQWQALRGDPAYQAAQTSGYDSIASVAQESNPHIVRVVFSKPYGPWKGLFSPLYPAAAMNSPTAFGSGSGDGIAATSGPFAIKSVDRKAGQVALVRNPQWWGKERPSLDGIDFVAVPDAQRVAALRSGQLDVADLSGAAEASGAGALREAAALHGFSLRRAAAPAYEQVTLNGGSGPLADPGLRRAVATAIDRSAVASAVLTPLGLPAAPLGNHLVMGDQDGYADDSSALGGGSGQAAKMLDAAGWSAGAPAAQAAAADAKTKSSSSARLTAAGVPIRAKDGKELSLTMVVPSGSATAQRVAELVVRQLGSAGIDTKVQAVDPSAFFSSRVASGDFDLALFSWPASRFPVADEVPLYAKPGVDQDGVVARGQNLSATGTDQIDQLLNQAVGATDPKDASRLTSQADSHIWALAPSVPLYQKPQVVAVRDGVAGVGAFGFTTPRWASMGFRR